MFVNIVYSIYFLRNIFAFLENFKNFIFSYYKYTFSFNILCGIVRTHINKMDLYLSKFRYLYFLSLIFFN